MVIVQNSASNHDRILDAAEILLARYGYRKMTVADLAAEAGIGKGTVYLSFRSKEDVVLATVDRIVDAVCAEMERVRATDGPPSRRIGDMLLARILVRFDRVSAYREGINDLLASIRPSLFERRKVHFGREIRILAAVVREGQEAGEMIPARPRDLARSLLLATNQFLPHALSPAELGNRQRLQRDAAGVIELLVGGLTRIETDVTRPGMAASKGDHR